MIPAHVLEGMMLFCFSVGWYFSIARMLRLRAATGKSPFFVVLVCTGNLLGACSKLVVWRQTGVLSPVVWLYAWNFAVVALDLALVLHFSRRTRKAADCAA